MQVINHLNLSPYLHATNKRMAIVSLRIASIFAVLRAYEDDATKIESKESITPTDSDLNASLSICETLINHAIHLYNILPKTSHSDAKGERHKQFLFNLPNEFTTSEAEHLGKKLNIPKRTVRDWLKKSTNIKRTRRGEYEKRM